MKSPKQIPPRNPIEYHFFIGREYDENKRKESYLLVLRTAKDFRNFLYKLVVKDSIDGEKLCLTIEGLRTPQPSLPGFGPAEWRKHYDELPPQLSVAIEKLGGARNEFQVTISRDGVNVVATPDNPFVDLNSLPGKF